MTEETYKAHSENIINLQWSCNQCSDLQRDDAELNSTENQPVINDGFSDIKNCLHRQPGLNVGHLNAEGLRGKLPKIKFLLLETGLDILAITETKLPSNVSDEEMGIEGYFVARKDRDSNAGGVLLYYKQTLTAYEETKLKVPSEMERIWINVNSQSQTWLVACVYRPGQILVLRPT